MPTESNLGHRSLRARKKVSYVEKEVLNSDNDADIIVSSKKIKLEKNDDSDASLKLLYEKLAKTTGKSTNLETIYESPKGNKKRMSLQRHKRVCITDFSQPNKTKVKARNQKAKKLAKLNGFKLPTGKKFTVDDVASVLSNISDSEDDSLQRTPKPLHNRTPMTPLMATPKMSSRRNPQSPSFHSGTLLVADDTHPDVPTNWREVMSPEDLFNHSMSVLDQSIFGEEEEEIKIKPKNHKKRRSGGLRDHLKGVISVRREFENRNSFIEKLEDVSEESSSQASQVQLINNNSLRNSSSIENDDQQEKVSNSKKRGRKKKEIDNTECSSNNTVKGSKRRFSGVQKSLYAPQLEKSPAISEEDSSVDISTSDHMHSESFTDEDGNTLSETALKIKSPEIVLKIKNIPSCGTKSSRIIPLTTKLSEMEVDDSSNQDPSEETPAKAKKARRSRSLDKISVVPEVKQQPVERSSPTKLMSSLTLGSENQQDAKVKTPRKSTRRRSVRLMPYAPSVATKENTSTEQPSDDKNLGRRWVDKTPKTSKPKKSRKSMQITREGLDGPQMETNEPSHSKESIEDKEKITQKESQPIITEKIKNKKTKKPIVKGNASKRKTTEANSSALANSEFKMKSNPVDSSINIPVVVEPNKDSDPKYLNITPTENSSDKSVDKHSDKSDLSPAQTHALPEKCQFSSNNLPCPSNSDDIKRSGPFVENYKKNNSVAPLTDLVTDVINLPHSNESSGASSSKSEIKSHSSSPVFKSISPVSSKLELNTISKTGSFSSPSSPCSSDQAKILASGSSSSPSSPSQVKIHKASPTGSPSSPTQSQIKKTLQTVSKFQTRYGLFRHPCMDFEGFDGKKESPSKGTKKTLPLPRVPTIHPALSDTDMQSILEVRLKSLLSSNLRNPLLDPPCTTHTNSPGNKNNSNPNSPNQGRKNRIMLTSLSETEKMLDIPSPESKTKKSPYP